MLPEKRLGISPPPPSGTRVKFTFLSATVHSARMSEPEPAEVIPTFLPASSSTFVTLESGFTTRYQP